MKKHSLLHISEIVAGFVVGIVVVAPLAYAQDDVPASVPASESTTISWEVNGVKREAIVYAPTTATTTPAPLVFAFHGHGGSAKQFASGGKFQSAWPEAIVVYPQGLPTSGMTDPKGLKAGWQGRAGIEDDRDLKFFDAMLAGLKAQYKVDDRRIYSTGHSNGGGFTYLLWAQRGENFAAFGPSAAGMARGPTITPRPLIHIAGESDTVVPIAFQTRSMDAARSLNGCESEGKPWAQYCTEYPSKNGTPIVICLQPGGHKYYGKATELVVRFFKEHALPAADAVPAPTSPVASPATPPATR